MPRRTALLRQILRRGVELSLVHAGGARLARRLRPVDTVVLAYHDITPDQQASFGERSLHLPVEQFRRQLDWLQETHHIVPLEQVADLRASDGRARAIITFDDAYRGAVTQGVAEVARRGLPATVFVNPGLIDGRQFWWDMLADPASGELAAELRRQALDECGGREDEIRRRWPVDGSGSPSRVPAHAGPARLGDLRSAVRLPGVSLASHTWSHPDLTQLTEERVASELSDSLAWLRKRFEQVIPWLSYPYGRSSPSVRRAVAAAGYQGAVLVEGGVVRDRRKVDPYAVPRVNVPAGVSLEGFMLRVAGLGPS